MSEPARLQALRLQGFKSFAERTVVELVPGINAVIGPNGSGKSNLADALRWALGEQGRALRSRRAEDVVFAGSERRAALGMADVTLVLGNADRLLPVDYATIEIGRRLYRSGENEYLLNRQRVRLRDLVDLLDAANLADNAFLFIGQGMVDQALALRPEERRPLFEEVAGVRRHERRRRRAEEQLIEASANLARVEDILAELRPQVRRLAAQAEQHVSRARAADDLAQALVTLFAGRWHGAARSAAAAETALATARRSAADALGSLQEAEERAAGAGREVATHVATEVERRAAHEEARTLLAAIDLATATWSAEQAAIRRDRARLAAELDAAGADLATHRRSLALPLPPVDHALDGELAELDAALADGRAEIAALRAAGARRSEEAAALRRAAAAATEALESLRRRTRSAADAHRDAAAAAERAVAVETSLREAVTVARAAWEEAVAGEGIAREQAEAARGELARAEAARGPVAEAATAARSRASALRGRADALQARVTADDGRSIAATARRHGGRPLADGLDIDPAQRRAAAIALGDLGRAFILDRDRLAPLAGERGSIVLGDAHGPGAGPPPAAETEAARTVAGRHGGGLLVDAVRSDPGGTARRLLARWAWAPTIDDAVEIAAALPVGWRVAAGRGGVAGVDGVVVLGEGDTPLERRQDLQAITVELAAADAEVGACDARLAAADAGVAAARDAAEATRRTASDAARAVRDAEEALRGAERRAEHATREAAWVSSRSATLAAELQSLEERLAEVERPVAAAAPAEQGVGGQAPDATTGALAAWEARVAELVGRREAVATARAAREAGRRAAETRRAGAEAAAHLAEERIARAEAEAATLANVEAERAGAAVERDRARAEASAREAHLRQLLDAVRAADAAGREALRAAESDAATARERLRRAEESLRAAEVADLEARLALDAVREQALVELAGLGRAGLRALGTEPDETTDEPPTADPAPEPADGELPDDDDGGTLAAAVAAAGARWFATEPPTEPPTPGQLAALRRRFHALGAANPFAAQEHEELRTRVDGLEAQRTDLVGAIDRTRTLMAELDELITRQFRATFAALEVAFERQFERLFGGGFARLALTDPSDIAQSGVEIVARPPGKKTQALAMLSGGERALTAVALLFGMLDVRPVPFCVLDEVDAALDEANIGRFVDSLRDLARATQFIVITHNRGTIEAADALYGVTVGDDAVSRVVSLRVEEAREIAASVRDGRLGRGTGPSAG